MSVNSSLSGKTFKEQLAFGQIAETQIARWLLARGGVVLPIYDVEIQSGKGPRVFSKDEQFAAPDLLVASSGGVHWIEAKHKTVFTWHRISKQWTTGIDLHHYSDYRCVEERIPWPVWLLFLHRSATPDSRDMAANCPEACPVGLFGNPLSVLVDNESHQHCNHGRHGMVYWGVDSLRRIATLEEVCR